MFSTARLHAAAGGKHVILVSIFHVKPGLESLVIDELLVLVRQSRREAGCLLFDLYRHTSDRSEVHEIWHTPETLEAHSSAPHTSRFRVFIAQFLERAIEVHQVDEIAV